MHHYQITALALGIMISANTAWGQAVLPQSSPPTSISPQQPTATVQSLSNEAQQDMGTAQLLFKLGQTKAQLGQVMEQSEARDNYWKAYVEGINQQVGHSVAGEAGKPPTGAK